MLKYVILCIFVIITISVGLFSRRKVNSVQDFLIGGRKMGPWFSAFAYGTTYFSAVIFIGYAGRYGWNFGISSTWIGIGNAILGSLLAWLVLARRTRKMTHDLNASTMPEFFEKRYDSKPMKIATALIIFVFMVPYSASVYSGLGYLFGKAFGIPYEYCMLAMALLTGLYLMLGGYVATAMNDFIQGIIMVAGLVLMIYFILGHPSVGGLAGGLSKLHQMDPKLVSTFSATPMDLLGLVILTSLGTWGLPQMITKFYAIKDDKSVRIGTVISTIFCTVIAGGAYFIGGFGKLILNGKAPVDAVTGKINLDMVMPNIVGIAMPEWMLGIIVVLVLSASMSTLSSVVLVSSSAITVDLVKGVFFPKVSKENTMLLMRILCAAFVALSFALAIGRINAIVTLMSLSWGTIAGCFLAPFLYGLYWKRTTRIGAWAGIVAGFTTSVGGFVILGMNPKLSPNIGAAAMLVSLIVVPVVSLMTAKMPEKHIETVFNGELNKKLPAEN